MFASQSRFFTSTFLAGIVAVLVPVYAQAVEVDFDRDIRPLLSNHCFHCHGPDENHREAGLRLDVRTAAIAELDSGQRAIVPGVTDTSELLRRIDSTDAEDQMPPPESQKPLTAQQRQLLRAWIEQGAEYTQHWSFVPPQRPPLPSISDATWPTNAIDHFVAHRLEPSGLQPASPAAPDMLLRRLYLDLTGLPPTPPQVSTFSADPSESAYAKSVNRLLASPQFGERLAMFWLDAARYSDTDGFQQDATRTNWPWRDWVIDAFNKDMPFDQFTLEQFAGDLLPQATPEQKLATCFHRNHMTNGEGGRDPEESRIDYVIDRVNTTGTVWLGLTLGCCQCHSHKYDPISHAEYYQLFAFFNSIDENGSAGSRAKPYLPWTPSSAQASIATAESWLTTRQTAAAHAKAVATPRFETWLAEQVTNVPVDYASWHTLPADHLAAVSSTVLQPRPDGSIQATGPDPHHEDYHITTRASSLLKHAGVRRITALRLQVLPDASHTQSGLSRSETGHFILSDVKLRVRSTTQNQIRDIRIASAMADFSANPGKNGGYGNIAHTLDDDPRNGWASFGAPLNESRTAVFALQEPLVLQADDEVIIEMQQRALRGRHNLGRFRWSATAERGEVPRSLKQTPLEALAAANAPQASAVDAQLRERLFTQFLDDDPAYVRAVGELQTAQSQLNEFRKAAGKLQVMVLAERSKPRATHILQRGVWNQPGTAVQRGFPQALGNTHSLDKLDRLQLAKWLTSQNNPLTARVIVNHLWRLVFGAGLVPTAEDFGVQGERPTHPQLLDWLAVELMECDWDIEHIIRLMVSSSTYRQTSDVTDEVVRRDPTNRLLARAMRYRLPAWIIRDKALAAGGILNSQVGGPPFRPYQPQGVWADITMGRFRYVPSVGVSRYRRTVYAFWRRSASPPFLFDSAQRRVCEVATTTTNTPLQALTLLNDLTMLEAARAVALRAVDACETTDQQIAHMWNHVLGRNPTEVELATVRTTYETSRQRYETHPKELENVLNQGQILPWAQPTVQNAALTVVASMILNLDEAITRQ